MFWNNSIKNISARRRVIVKHQAADICSRHKSLVRQAPVESSWVGREIGAETINKKMKGRRICDALGILIFCTLKLFCKHYL